MFGLGFWEIVAIIVVVVVVVRPRDLPSFVRKLGRIYGRILDLHRLFTKTMRDAERQIRSEAQEAPQESGSELTGSGPSKEE